MKRAESVQQMACRASGKDQNPWGLMNFDTSNAFSKLICTGHQLGVLVLWHRNAYQHFQNQGQWGWEWKLKWKMKFMVNEALIQRHGRSWPLLFLWQGRFTIIFIHIIGYIFYTSPPLLPYIYIYIKGLYARLVLQIPADVYVKCMDTFSDQSGSENSRSPEQRRFRE